MDLTAEIRSAEGNPQKLETLYQVAKHQGQADAFRTALTALHETDPGNMLYAAWFYRLQPSDEEVKPRRGVNWALAILLSVLTGLIFWALSDFENLTIVNDVPQLLLWWSPIATMSALIFLALTAKRGIGRALALGAGVLAAAAYVVLISPTFDAAWKTEQYVIVAAIHLPLLSWIALGLSVLGFNSSTEDRFAFLIKSVEVLITAGLYLAAGAAFGGLTIGLFAALGIDLPELWIRLITAGGFGLLPVLAVATVYDPTLPPAEQDFDQGLSRLISTMMRLLLPLTLVVLVIYSFVIPFNFFAPFQDRDLLIVYNLMLFGILGLLVGATPIRMADLAPSLRRWLRLGIIIVAVLTVLISIYALAATVSRTVAGGITINRLTVIGWDVINIGVLFWLLAKQVTSNRENWIGVMQSVFSKATNAYLVWGLFLVAAVPLLF